jgi:hypothetical protein
MIDDSYGSVDVGGSPYGTDIHTYHNPWSSTGFGWVDDCF